MSKTLKEKLEWKNDKRKVSDLKKWKSNPRQWTEQDIERMSKSIEQFGYTEPIMIDVNNVIVAGNLRYHVLCLQGKHSKTIDVRVPNRKLTAKEFEHYGLLDNKIGEGKWDFEGLANMGLEICLEVGFTERQLGIDMSSPIDLGDTAQRSSEYDFEQEQAKAERERLQKKFEVEKEKIEREAREKLLTDLKTGKEQLPDVIRNRVLKNTVCPHCKKEI